MSYFIVFLFPKTHDFKQLEDVWVRRAYPCWSRVVYYTKGSKTEMQTEPQHWSLWVLNHIHLRFWGYRLEQFWCTVVAIYYSFFFPPGYCIWDVFLCAKSWCWLASVCFAWDSKGRYMLLSLFLASVRHIESISFSRTPYFVCTVFHQPWTTFWVRLAKHAIKL